MPAVVQYLVGGLAVLSFALAIYSVILNRKTSRVLQQVSTQVGKTAVQLKETQSLIQKTSALVQSAQNLGVTKIYESRYDASDSWISHIKGETQEVVMLGTSLLGIKGWSDLEETIKLNPKIFKILLVHPEVAHKIAKLEQQKPLNKVRMDIIHTLNCLTTWGVESKNIKLLKHMPRNFVIFTSTKILINPSVYDTDTFKYFCIECEKKHGSNIYNQYYKNHYKVIWDSKLTVTLEEKDLNRWSSELSETGEDVEFGE